MRYTKDGTDYWISDCGAIYRRFRDTDKWHMHRMPETRIWLQ